MLLLREVEDKRAGRRANPGKANALNVKLISFNLPGEGRVDIGMQVEHEFVQKKMEIEKGTTSTGTEIEAQNETVTDSLKVWSAEGPEHLVHCF